MQIFSPEVVQFFDKIGINNSPMDLCTDNPLFLDFRRLFKIHVPRFFTFADLLNFITDQTNILSKEIMLFEYSPNQKENFIKRSDYNLKKVKPEEYESAIEIYTKNHKQHFPLLFLYTKNKNFNFFKHKPENLSGKKNNETAIEEDYAVRNIKNSISGVVYIPSKMNFLEFNLNNFYEVSDNEAENHFVLNDGKISGLIFLKLFLPNNLLQYLDLIDEYNSSGNINKNNNYSDNYSLRIIDVFEFNYNQEDTSIMIITSLKSQFLKKIEEFLEQIKNKSPEIFEFISNIKNILEKNDFSFITERTCLLEYPSDKLVEDISIENIKEILDKNNGIILIPSACEDNASDASLYILDPFSIKKQLDIYFNKLYIDVFCLSTNLSLCDKMEFNIREITDEKTIKQKILDKIKQEKLFNLIFKLKNNFIISASQETISAQDFIEKIDLSYFEIINNRDTNGKAINMYKEIPIAKYVNNTEMRIDLSFSYIPKTSLSEYKIFEVSLFDKDSNKIAFLSCVLPRKIKRSKEIVEFIAKSSKINMIFEDFNNDLFKSCSSSQIVLDKVNVNNSFFILQHARDCFIFHFITDENTDVFKFEGKGDYKYRLQMYDEAFITKINNPIYTKIYVKVCIFSSILEVKVDPLIIYLEKIQTNFELKLEVFKSLENLRNLNKALSPNYSNLQEFLQNEKNLEKIKFFKCAVNAGKFKKSSNINTFKEDDVVETIFRGERICNLLVEVYLNNLTS